MELMSNNKSSNLPTRAGFTIVELLIIAPIVLLTIGAFITAIVNMTGDVLASRGATVLTYNIQDALNRIEDDVKLSTTFLATNNIPLSSPQGYSDDTTAFNNVDATNGTMLILNTLATNGNPLVSTSGLVYLTNLPNACNSTQLSQNTPMTLNIVYFVRNGTLWRRTIMPAAYATAGCSVPWQQPSCNPALFSGGSWGSYGFCKTQDIRLVDNVSTGGFAINYFNTASATVTNTVANDGSSSTAVRNAALQSLSTLEASISVSTTSGGRPISQSGSIRVTKLDINASTIAPIVAPTTPSAPSGMTATFNSPGQITASWYPNATSYTLQYDTSSSFTSPTTINNISGSSQVVTGLSASPRYYFRVSATNSAGTSGWSSTAHASTTIINGLVAWWTFNGDANTSVGTANGTVTGATLTTGQTGQANTAYAFSAACCQYISTAALPALTSTLSISAWIYPTAYPSERAAIVVDSAGGSTDGYYFSLNSDGSLQSYWYGTSVPGYQSSGANTIPLNQWSFGTVTWSGSQVKLYVNGVLQTTATTTGGGAASNPIVIGAQTSTRQLAGKIDDLRMYSRVLSASEIQGLYTDGAR
jgi:hypothetical protein